jgi:NarL family two-component system response regulator LiaR
MPWLVLVVDDNASIRTAVRKLFEAEPDFEVIGEAKHGAESVERAVLLKPHLITLDFSMPVMDGLTAAPILLRRAPGVSIILLTLYAGDQMEMSARSAGIHTVLAKHHAPTHLITTARDLFKNRPMPDGKSAAA